MSWHDIGDSLRYTILPGRGYICCCGIVAEHFVSLQNICGYDRWGRCGYYALDRLSGLCRLSLRSLQATLCGVLAMLAWLVHASHRCRLRLYRDLIGGTYTRRSLCCVRCYSSSEALPGHR